MNEEKKKIYDSKHGQDAYYYRHTKSGQAQSKAYDNYHGLSKPYGKKKEVAGKMKKLDKPAKGNADKSPRTAKTYD
jgi:hypothetical protein